MRKLIKGIIIVIIIGIIFIRGSKTDASDNILVRIYENTKYIKAYINTIGNSGDNECLVCETRKILFNNEMRRYRACQGYECKGRQ